MIRRPRCREWTPLATQQLRLRSLVQIVGYNIRPPEQSGLQCLFYYTLHHTTMSAPFYTSEKICSSHPKWAEIDTEITEKMSSTKVVIRIWCHVVPTPDPETLRRDVIIQTWGVYFSGLKFLAANINTDHTAENFRPNTLVFQMQGGYFCSYKSVRQNAPDSQSGSSDSSVKTKNSVLPVRSNRLKKESTISKSHSPTRSIFKQSLVSTKSSLGLNIKPNIIDNTHILEHSPDDHKKCTSDIADVSDNNEDETIPKYRYSSLKFLKSEIRHSYNAAKLQKLHLLQYDIKKRMDAVKEVKDRIHMKSAIENTHIDTQEKPHEFSIDVLKEIQLKSLFSEEFEREIVGECSSHSAESSKSKSASSKDENQNFGPRLTLKLNDLLSYKAKPSPMQRLEHSKLTKLLEVYRFKKSILVDERDSKLCAIRHLKEKHSKMYEENQDMGTELMQGYHALCKRADVVREGAQSSCALAELAARAHVELARVRATLLRHLHDIFHIDKVEGREWRICNTAVHVCDDDALPHAAEAAGAGYAAQACAVAAAVLALPLPHAVRCRGSRSEVQDGGASAVWYPLYCKGGDPSAFQYGLYLLNRCISRLLANSRLPVHDLRPTLCNLQRLLTQYNPKPDTSKLFGLRWQEAYAGGPQAPLRSLLASDRGRQRQFNRFKDSVDGSFSKRHRHTRSVGSYTDVRSELSVSIVGSEPFLYEPGPNETPSATMKTHNSDSEISRMTIDQVNPDRVIFTLGEDTTLRNLQSQKLVRISTNDFELGEVEKIFDEIQKFCSNDALNEDFCCQTDGTVNAAKDSFEDDKKPVLTDDSALESKELQGTNTFSLVVCDKERDVSKINEGNGHCHNKKEEMCYDGIPNTHLESFKDLVNFDKTVTETDNREMCGFSNHLDSVIENCVDGTNIELNKPFDLNETTNRNLDMIPSEQNECTVTDDSHQIDKIPDEAISLKNSNLGTGSIIKNENCNLTNTNSESDVKDSQEIEVSSPDTESENISQLTESITELVQSFDKYLLTKTTDDLDEGIEVTDNNIVRDMLIVSDENITEDIIKSHVDESSVSPIVEFVDKTVNNLADCPKFDLKPSKENEHELISELKSIEFDQTTNADPNIEKITEQSTINKKSDNDLHSYKQASHICEEKPFELDQTTKTDPNNEKSVADSNLEQSTTNKESDNDIHSDKQTAIVSVKESKDTVKATNEDPYDKITVVHSNLDQSTSNERCSKAEIEVNSSKNINISDKSSNNLTNS